MKRPVIEYASLGWAQLCIGAAAIFARLALGGAGPFAVSAMRLAIAAVIVLAVAGIRGPRTHLEVGRKWWLAAAGFALAIHFAAWIASLQYTSVAIATLLVCTSPIFSGMAEAIRTRRAPSRSFAIALTLGAVGLALVVLPRSSPAPIPGFETVGAALALAGAIAIAAYLTIVRSTGEGVPTLAIVTRTYTWAAVWLVALAAIARESPPPLADAAAWSGILAMALISQLVGHTALNRALRSFSATAVGFATLLEPVIAAILAAIVFREGIGAATIVGGIAILAAIAFALRDGDADTAIEIRFGER